MKIAVCDDEKIFRDMILEGIKASEIPGDALQISEFSSGNALLSSYEKGEKYDLLFLDVEMEGLSGIETGNRIRRYDRNVLIVFVTGHSHYVPEAFRVNAFQFLVKPVRQEEITKEIERAAAGIRKRKRLYFIKKRDNIDIIEIKDILYIDVWQRHILVHTINGIHEKAGKIKEEIERMEEYDFAQYYKGGIVNLQNITGIRGDEIILKTGEKLHISRGCKADLKKKLYLYIESYSI